MNYEGALVTPNGLTKNSNESQRVLNAVFGISSLRIGICQYCCAPTEWCGTAQDWA